MGLFGKKQLCGATLGIWEITETAGELLEQASLTAYEQRYYAGLKTPLRKKHWLSYRLILPHVLENSPAGGIVYDAHGKPRLESGSGHISVAHSGNFACLAVSKARRVGVDIELMHPKIFRLSHRFLSAHEAAYDRSHKAMESLYLIWCAKEALYKLHGSGGLSFRQDIHIPPFRLENRGRLHGMITKEGNQRGCEVFYETIGPYMLAYALETNKQEPDPTSQ